MNEILINKHFDLPSNVSITSRNVFKANSNVRIKNISDMNVVVKSIHGSIHKCIFEKGVNMSEEEIIHLKYSVTDDVIKEFSVLSIEDVQLCFSMGVRGNLGEYYGLNTVTFYNWLKTYRNTILPEMFKEVKKYLPPVTPTEKEVDYHSLDIEKINNICEAILLFKNEKKYIFNDFGNIHYEFLNKHGYLDVIDEFKKIEILEDSKNELIKNKKEENNNLMAKGKSYHLIDIGKIINKIELNDISIKAEIDILYMKLILRYFIVHFFDYHSTISEFKLKLTSTVNHYYNKK